MNFCVFDGMPGANMNERARSVVAPRRASHCGGPWVKTHVYFQASLRDEARRSVPSIPAHSPSTGSRFPPSAIAAKRPTGAILIAKS